MTESKVIDSACNENPEILQCDESWSNTSNIYSKNVVNNVDEEEVVSSNYFPKNFDQEQCLANTDNNENNMTEELITNMKQLEEENSMLKVKFYELEAKMDLIIKQRDFSIKEKEIMVMKYAVSEKNLLDLQGEKNRLEKKKKEALSENELLQHKLSSMMSEKSRICQMLDNKCYDLKSSQQEIDKLKSDISCLETKLKWTQNNLKTEMDLRKESEKKAETISVGLQDATKQIEQLKLQSQENLDNIQHVQNNRVLEQHLKEAQANLILLRHDRDDKEKQIKSLQSEHEKLQAKQNEILHENNSFSLKIQQLEQDKFEISQQVNELKSHADQQKQDSTDLLAKTAQLEELKLEVNNKQKQADAYKDQMSLLKQRNIELENDMQFCRKRESELLLFTQQLTDKNVRLQSEFTAMETKVQQLQCEESLLKKTTKEQGTQVQMLLGQLNEERDEHLKKIVELQGELSTKSKLCDELSREISDQIGENSVIKRKLEYSLKEVTKELAQCRKQLDSYSFLNTNGTNAPLNGITVLETKSAVSSSTQDQMMNIESAVDKKTLLDHIVKLQKISARKSEKIDFLEEHINTLVSELQKKTQLLQSYIVREQSGALTSNKMENNKAHIAQLHGVMASLHGSRLADNNLTLKLSLDINHKLQSVLEDTLLKNIMLKENIDTLGAEIEKLTVRLKSSTS